MQTEANVVVDSSNNQAPTVSARHRRSFNSEYVESIEPVACTFKRMKLNIATPTAKIQNRQSSSVYQTSQPSQQIAQYYVETERLKELIQATKQNLKEMSQCHQKVTQMIQGKRKEYFHMVLEQEKFTEETSESRMQAYGTIDDLRKCSTTVESMSGINKLISKELSRGSKGEQKDMTDAPMRIAAFRDQELLTGQQYESWKTKVSQLQKRNKILPQQLERVQTDIDKFLFHISILRLGIMKNFRTGINIYENKINPNEIFSYTAWKQQKSRRLEIMQIVYGITGSLYPKSQSIFSKTHYSSKYFEILLKGQDIQPQISGDLKRKILNGLSNSMLGSKKNQSARQTKLLVFLASPVQDIGRQFKDHLANHLLGFNNDIIKILLIQHHKLKEPLEQIVITYSMGNLNLTKNIYLFDLKTIPTLEQLQSIEDSRRKSNLSEYLKDITQRKGYILVQFPLMIRTEEMKMYQEINDFLKKLK